ncbi:MAG: SpoIIE family protein phosphatase, partial [Ruminococcus sp.]|nr:SpoIIE family protein phosphatase [Ruminococcus sp.]
EELLTSACAQTPLRSSPAVRGQVSAKLENSGYSASEIIAGYDSRSRLVIEIYFPAGTSPDSFTRVRDLVSDCLKMQLDMTEPDTSGREVRVRLTEPAEYVCEVYGAAACAEDNTENGDTFSAFSDGSAQYIILSDGMGSGRRAAFQSRMVVRLFRRLVSAGAGILPAVRLVNSIMFTKSGEETFATLDAVKIGLTDCTLTLVKSGASATLIRHRGSVLKVTAPTFPIGIYESGEAFVSDYDIEDGDIVIMFSDGISENEYLFIKELLLSGDDVRHIVDEICAKAELFDPNIRADDVTVIGIRVCRRGGT